MLNTGPRATIRYGVVRLPFLSDYGSPSLGSNIGDWGAWRCCWLWCRSSSSQSAAHWQHQPPLRKRLILLHKSGS
jgi:hypothetical protein